MRCYTDYNTHLFRKLSLVSTEASVSNEHLNCRQLDHISSLTIWSQNFVISVIATDQTLMNRKCKHARDNLRNYTLRIFALYIIAIKMPGFVNKT